MRPNTLPAGSAPGPRTWLAVLAALLAAGMWLHGPIAQWPDHHAFADARPWLGLPNAANVLSNLPFVAVAAWAGLRLRGAACGPAPWAWSGFCAALACTAIGSAVYHAAPSNPTLVIDRIPIAWACASLLCALLGERVHPRWAGPPVLAAALGLATLAVLHWWWTETTGAAGAGDLRAYLLLQGLALLLVPAALLLRLPATAPHATADSAWWGVVALYAVAKACEVADHRLFESLGELSGHTLKHLLAAAGAGWLLRGVVAARRGRLRPPSFGRRVSAGELR